MDSQSHSIGVVCVWIGPFLDYFPLWWRSAQANDTIDFHLMTDQDVKLNAKNIFVHHITLETESQRFSCVLGVDVQISRPYKLCDYKPLYGEAYSEYLDKYDYWGYCDLDIVFGDIRTFVTDSVLSAYDIVYRTGQLCLYRNTYEMRNLWRREGSIYSRSELIDPLTNCGFDEYYGIMRIASFQGVRIYPGTDSAQNQAGFLPYGSEFFAVFRTNYPRQAFYWSDGKAYHRWVMDDGFVGENEVVLMHFMGGRKLRYDKHCASSPFFTVSVKRGFVPCEFAPGIEDMPIAKVPSPAKRRIQKLMYGLRRFCHAPVADKAVKINRWCFHFETKLKAKIGRPRVN